MIKTFKLFMLVCIALSSNIYSQVGINTTDPQTTLDVIGVGTSTTTRDGIIAPRITRQQLAAKSITTYAAAQTGAIVYVTDATLPTGTIPSVAQTIEIINSGYYFFNGIIWKNINSNAQNIYNTNGTLTGTRVVTQAGNTLSFTGTAVNAFSVDGTTLSVDATNDRVGMGTIAPTNRLHVVSAANPIKLEGLQNGTLSDRILTVNSTGEVKTIASINTISVPTPAIFKLDADIPNFLNGVVSGASSNIAMSVVKNSIAGLTYNAVTGLVQFPIGTYQISVIYEAEHNATACTLSSYIVDFPFDQGSTRIHSTATHNQGLTSNHGGTILYSTRISAPIAWNIQLGRGQSGNCTGTGNTLKANSTQVLILRMGD